MAAFIADLREAHEEASRCAPTHEVSIFALGAPASFVEDLLANLAGGAYVAMDNCPHQCVAVLDVDCAEEALAAFTREGLVCQRLPFDRPYHTPLFEDYALSFEGFFARWIKALPEVPLYSCATAAKVPDDLDEFRRLAWRQWTMPVRFQETVEVMYADGVRIFVEVGPRGNLTAFVDEVLKGRPHLAVAADVRSRSGVTQLHHMLGLLAAHHVLVDLAPLYAGRSPRSVDLGDGRVSAMAEHFDRMTRLLDEEREAMRAYFARRAAGDPSGGTD
jgi:acyl transferase domain-containing protein